MESELNDEDLVAAIKKNDHAAFKKIYWKYRDMLLRFAWFRTHSSELSSELVQQLFVNLWIKRNNLNQKKSIKAYLFKSLGNIIINYLKLKSTANLHIENVDEKFISENVKYDSAIDLNNAIQKLSFKQAQVFMLHRYDGFSYPEISELLGISVKAVEKRITKSLKTLRKILTSGK